jgi:hypothetical protein
LLALWVEADLDQHAGSIFAWSSDRPARAQTKMGGVADVRELRAGLLRAVDAVDWAAYAMPPSQRWYSPEQVPAAFRRLLLASGQAEARAAYDRMLFAVGNNHAGCLYPAAVPAAPLLARVVRERWGWARWAAIEILTEFVVFDVDRAEFTDPAGLRVDAKDAIVAAVLEIHDDLVRLGRSPIVVPAGESARDLLEALDEETSGGPFPVATDDNAR